MTQYSATKLTLDAFKSLLSTDTELVNRITNNSDIIDMDNGSMIIHRANINKYLEQYMCKSEDDLSDTLWFSYGIFVRVVD